MHHIRCDIDESVGGGFSLLLSAGAFAAHDDGREDGFSGGEVIEDEVGSLHSIAGSSKCLLRTLGSSLPSVSLQTMLTKRAVKEIRIQSPVPIIAPQ